MTATLDAPAGLRRPPDRSGDGRSGVWLGRAWRARGGGLPEHWPFTALVVGFPLWWAIGFGPFAVTVFAVPMAWKLRRMRPIQVPKGFGVWLFFLLAVLVSGLMLGRTAPGTLPAPVGGQLLGYLLRVIAYVAAAVLLLFIGNLGEKLLPERLILGSLAVLFGVTVAGGLLGLVAPHFSFTSPVELLLPHSLSSGYLHTLTHPAAAQVQDVLGYSAPRPMAPFEYTNTWGNVIGLLVVWVFAWAGKVRGRRLLATVAVAVAAVPIVLSLNRGLWIGLALAVFVMGVKLLLSGRLFAVVGLTTLVAMGGVAFLVSPLAPVVQARLANGDSNDIRSNLAAAAIRGAQESPDRRLGHQPAGRRELPVDRDRGQPGLRRPVRQRRGRQHRHLLAGPLLRGLPRHRPLHRLLPGRPLVLPGRPDRVRGGGPGDPADVVLVHVRLLLDRLAARAGDDLRRDPVATSAVGPRRHDPGNPGARRPQRRYGVTDERAGYLRELVPLLWPAPATATLGQARHPNADRSYLILPSLAKPRLLVPRRPRRATGGALRGYGEQSSTARRLAVRVASAVLAAGTGDLLLRDRLEIAGRDTVEDHLGRELGRPVRLSLHLGPARANRKPVLQLLDERGRTVGFAKVATTPLAAQLVVAETAALAELAAAGLRLLTPPRVLSAGSWRGLEILVQSTAAGPPAPPPVGRAARRRHGRGGPGRRHPPGVLRRSVRVGAAGPGGRAADGGDPRRAGRRAGRAAGHRADHRLLARRLDPVEHRGRRRHRAGLGLGAVRGRSPGRLRRAALRPAAAGAEQGRRGGRRGGRLGGPGRGTARAGGGAGGTRGSGGGALPHRDPDPVRRGRADPVGQLAAASTEGLLAAARAAAPVTRADVL